MQIEVDTSADSATQATWMFTDAWTLGSWSMVRKTDQTLKDMSFV